MSDTFDAPEKAVTEDVGFDTPSDPHAFCIAGLPGSGKSTVANAIVSDCKTHFEFATATEVSDFVRTKFVAEHDDDVSDNELGRWATEQKDEHGQGYFVREMCEALDVPQRPHLAIAGLRSPAEAEAAREVFGHGDTTIISVWTLPDIRFERKYGESPREDHPEYDTFLERNQREIHDWDCVEFFMEDGPSDYVLTNNSDLGTLDQQVQVLVHHEAIEGLASFVGHLAETPFPDGLDRERVAQYL